MPKYLTTIAVLFLAGCNDYSHEFSNSQRAEIEAIAAKVWFKQAVDSQEGLMKQAQYCKKVQTCIGKPTEITLDYYGGFHCVLKDTKAVVTCE